MDRNVVNSMLLVVEPLPPPINHITIRKNYVVEGDPAISIILNLEIPISVSMDNVGFGAPCQAVKRQVLADFGL